MKTQPINRRANDPASSRGLIPGRAVTALIALACIVAAFPTTTHAKEEKALFDARTLFMFPLHCPDMPPDAEQMKVAMRKGFERQVEFPDGADPISIEGGVYPYVERLDVDLSHARGDASRKQATPSYKKPRATMHVERLAVRGEPFLFEGCKITLNLQADDALLVYNLDKDGHPAMIVTEAREGTLEFEVALDDLRTLMREQARKAGRRYGVKIHQTTVHLAALEERALWVEISARGSLGTGFQLNGKIEVDENMNAKTSGVLFNGNGILGKLVVMLAGGDIRKKYEGRESPLVRFPSKHMKLKDVKFQVDRTVRITAKYGM